MARSFFVTAFSFLCCFTFDIVLGNSKMSHEDKFDYPPLENVIFEDVQEIRAWKNEKDTNNNDIKRQVPSLEEVLYEKDLDEEGRVYSQNYVKEYFPGIPNMAFRNRNLPGIEDILGHNIQGNNSNSHPGEGILIKPGSISVSENNGNFDPTFDKEFQRLRNNIIKYLPKLIEEGVRNAESFLDIQKANENKTSPYISPSRKTDPESKRISECTGLSRIETMKLIVERFPIPKDKITQVLDSIPIEKYQKNLRTKYCVDKRKRITPSSTPSFATRMTCDQDAEYRTITGMCNNLQNPELGASNTPFARFLPPDYGDGFNSLRGEGGNAILPSPRLVSGSLSRISSLSNPSPDIHLTQMLKAWGQIVDHDLTFAPESDVHDCCDDGRLANVVNTDQCRPILTNDDPFYRQFGVECLRFTRSLPAATGTLGKREQFNSLTAFLDGSQVYGSTEEKTVQLRAFQNGMLKENQIGEDGSCTGSSHCNMPFLPENPGSSEANLFNAGDSRVNEQPGLTTMHTMLFRFHNFIAEKLNAKNPNFNDEKVFQETRKIVIAVIQHITYNEFLALVLGKKYMKDFGLFSGKSGFLNAYDPSIDPSIRNVFSAAAMRVGHTFITKVISGANSVDLETVFNMNSFMKSDDKMFPSNILKGECTNPAERYDVKLVDAITNRLFALPPSFSHGNDLMSLNIQRARDHGIPSYNNWRRFCGKEPFKTFDEMRSEMPSEVVEVFRRVYRSVNDIDLFPACLGEFKTTYGFIADTFSCILSRQFQALKYGDRFWYEGTSQPNPFTIEQLSAIRNTSLASVICVTSTITSIQPYPMLQSTLRRNEERPCSTYITNTVMESIEKFW